MVTNVDIWQQMAKMAANIRKYATIDDKQRKVTRNGEKRWPVVKMVTNGNNEKWLQMISKIIPSFTLGSIYNTKAYWGQGNVRNK